MKTGVPSMDSDGEPAMWIWAFLMARALSLWSFLLGLSSLAGIVFLRFRRRGRYPYERCVTVEMPFSWHLIRSFAVIVPSRLKSSRSTARAGHRDWKSQVGQCSFRTSGGGSLEKQVDAISATICRVLGRCSGILIVFVRQPSP